MAGVQLLSRLYSYRKLKSAKNVDDRPSGSMCATCYPKEGNYIDLTGLYHQTEQKIVAQTALFGGRSRQRRNGY